MMEPEYLRQFSLNEIHNNPRFMDEVIFPAARSAGVTFGRVSWREDLQIALYEGWKEKPEDQGEIRWMLVAGDPV